VSFKSERRVLHCSLVTAPLLLGLVLFSCPGQCGADGDRSATNSWPEFVRFEGASQDTGSCGPRPVLYVAPTDGQMPDLPGVLVAVDSSRLPGLDNVRQQIVVAFVDPLPGEPQTRSFLGRGKLHVSEVARMLVWSSYERPGSDVTSGLVSQTAYDFEGRHMWQREAIPGYGALSSKGDFALVSPYRPYDGPREPLGPSLIVGADGEASWLSGIGTKTHPVWSPDGDRLYCVSTSGPGGPDTLCAYTRDGARAWVVSGVGLVTTDLSPWCSPIAAGYGCVACISCQEPRLKSGMSYEEMMQVPGWRTLSLYSSEGELRWQERSLAESGPVWCDVARDGSTIAAVWHEAPENRSGRVVIRMYDSKRGSLLHETAFPPQFPEETRFRAVGIALSPDGRLVCVSVEEEGREVMHIVGVISVEGELVAHTDALGAPSCRWLDEETLVLCVGETTYVTQFPLAEGGTR